VVTLLRSARMRRGLATAILAVDCRRGTSWPSNFNVVQGDENTSRKASAIEAAVFGVHDALRSLLEAVPRQSAFRQWLAFDNGIAVGACLTYVDRECSWFGWSATLPQYRRRGVQRALLARCIQDAASNGSRWMTAETAIGTRLHPDASYANLRRAGFVELYRRYSYLYLPRIAPGNA
jgi:GNAT superfamily N-acetyltransferase